MQLATAIHSSGRKSDCYAKHKLTQIYIYIYPFPRSDIHDGMGTYSNTYIVLWYFVPPSDAIDSGDI